MGLLPLTYPVSHSARSMPKADALSIQFQLLREKQRIKIAKAIRKQISNKLNLLKESSVSWSTTYFFFFFLKIEEIVGIRETKAVAKMVIACSFAELDPI